MSRDHFQPHRKAINIPGHAHELTFSCYQRLPFLQSERTCQWLADAIETAKQKHAFDLWAYVFMPEHVHLVIRPRRPVHQIGAILSSIKLPVSRRAIAFLQEQNSPWLER